MKCPTCGADRCDCPAPDARARGAAWPSSVSDGLTLPCPYCGQIPRFNYLLSDEAWRDCVPKEHRLGVVCLPCLDRLATEQGVNLANLIEEVQFCGTDYTVVLWPALIHTYYRDGLRAAEGGER